MRTIDILEPGTNILCRKQGAEKFIRSLPPAFANGVTEEDRKDISRLVEKAYKFIHSHPQCRLRDEDVYKEKTQSVNVVTNANTDSRAPQAGARPKTGRDTRTCFICHKPGHIARNCYHRNSNYNRGGYRDQNRGAQFHNRRGNQRNQGNQGQRSYQTPCSNCGRRNHETRDCIDKPNKQKWEQKF